jgi:hypothetical protein
MRGSGALIQVKATGVDRTKAFKIRAIDHPDRAPGLERLQRRVGQDNFLKYPVALDWDDL